MQKPLISAAAEMGGFMLVGAPAPSPGEHKAFWYAALRTAATRSKITDFLDLFLE